MLDVLIAEDDSDLREMLAGCVAGLGYRVHEAADGEAALDILGTTPIDILLTDWMMPRLDGFTLCSRVKIGASPPYVILMTASAPRGSWREYGPGADDFLTKPINLDVLDVRLLAASRHIHTQQRLVDLNAKLRRDSERSLAIARSDPLTGLGNRLALDKELRRISANAARYMSSLSIAMCDIDYFKHYNDRYGSPRGRHRAEASGGDRSRDGSRGRPGLPLRRRRVPGHPSRAERDGCGQGDGKGPRSSAGARDSTPHGVAHGDAHAERRRRQPAQRRRRLPGARRPRSLSSESGPAQLREVGP